MLLLFSVIVKIKNYWFMHAGHSPQWIKSKRKVVSFGMKSFVVIITANILLYLTTSVKKINVIIAIMIKYLLLLEFDILKPLYSPKNVYLRWVYFSIVILFTCVGGHLKWNSSWKTRHVCGEYWNFEMIISARLLNLIVGVTEVKSGPGITGFDFLVF